MRPIDIDTAGRVWLYKPKQHKNLYRGRIRTIYLGPKAQAVIQPFLAGVYRGTPTSRRLSSSPLSWSGRRHVNRPGSWIGSTNTARDR